jgi:transposase InsO family protein
MALSTVSAVLRRLGLGKLKALEPRRCVQRYEREHPGELLHIDTKKLGRIQGIGHRITGNRRDGKRGGGWEYAHVCIDDASRVAYVEILDDERVTSAVPFLERAVAWFGRRGIQVHQVMTDNGSAYISHRHADACQKLALRHLRTRPYTPRTNGKAERFIQTLCREWAYGRAYRSSAIRRSALTSWLTYYNQQRPHRSLGMLTPMARLQGAL